MSSILNGKGLALRCPGSKLSDLEIEQSKIEGRERKREIKQMNGTEKHFKQEGPSN